MLERRLKPTHFQLLQSVTGVGAMDFAKDTAVTICTAPFYLFSFREQEMEEVRSAFYIK